MKKRSQILDIRRQLVVFDTHLNALDAGLQELPGFQASPDFDHGEIAGAQDGRTALCAELAEDGEGSARL